MNNLSAEEQRLLTNNLTPQERENIRQTEYWENCLDAYLDSAKPSLIRKRVHPDPTNLLNYLDGQAIWLQHRIRKGEEMTDVMESLFPMYQDSDDLDDEEDPMDPDEFVSLKRLLLPPPRDS